MNSLIMKGMIFTDTFSVVYFNGCTFTDRAPTEWLANGIRLTQAHVDILNCNFSRWAIIDVNTDSIINIANSSFKRSVFKEITQTVKLHVMHCTFQCENTNGIFGGHNSSVVVIHSHFNKCGNSSSFNCLTILSFSTLDVLETVFESFHSQVLPLAYNARATFANCLFQAGDIGGLEESSLPTINRTITYCNDSHLSIDLEAIISLSDRCHLQISDSNITDIKLMEQNLS